MPDAAIEQFAVDEVQPPGILPAYLADQISVLARNGGSSGLAALHFQVPEQTTADTLSGIALG
jgi:hypothetical protein